jgi:hypothetical protein
MSLLRRRARGLLLLVVAVGVLVVCVFTVVVPLPQSVTHAPAGHGCADFRRDFPARQGDTAETGFGIVQQCREAGSSEYLFQLRGSRYFFLLTTTTGVFAVRVEYLNLDAGRQYVSTVTEVEPRDVPGLSRAERDQVRAGIAARGGLTGTWTLHYGDG